jgi:potassium efflux system protein
MAVHGSKILILSFCLFALTCDSGYVLAQESTTASGLSESSTSARTERGDSNQGPGLSPGTEPLTIEARLAEIDATDLDETEKGRIKQLYQDARRQLETAQQRAAQAAVFRQTFTDAPQELESVRRALAAPAEAASSAPPPATVVDAQQRLAEVEQQIATDREEQSWLNAEPTRRQTRLREVPAEVTAASQRLIEIEKQLSTAPPEGESAALTSARLALLGAERKAIETQIDELDKEQKAYAATTELLPMRRDLVARRAAAGEERRAGIAALLEKIRREDAEQRVSEARRDAQQTQPALHTLAEENQQLAERARQQIAELNESNRHLQGIQTMLEEISNKFERTREKVETVGLTDALGILLRSERDYLAKSRNQHQPDLNREATIRDVQLDLLEMEDVRATLADPESLLPQLRAAVTSGEWGPEIELSAMQLLETKRTTLDTLISNQRSWFESLVMLDTDERKLVAQIDDFADYIESRILWVHSAPPIGLETPRTALLSLRALSAPDPWIELVLVSWKGIRERFPLLLAFSAGFLLLLYQQPKLRLRIRGLAEAAKRRSCRNFQPTLEALVATIAIAAVWPTLLCFLGWRLLRESFSTELGPIIGNSLILTGGYVLFVEMTKQICRPNGLASAHFDWSESAAKVVRRQMRWLWIAGIPVLVFVALQYYDQQPHRQSLGRLCFIIACLMWAFSCHQLLRPGGPIFPSAGDENRTALHRFRIPIYLSGAGVPITLAILAGFGYYFSAYESWVRWLETAYLVLFMVLLHGILQRSILMSRRRIAYMRHQQIIAEAAIQQRDKGEIPIDAEPEIELRAISEQSKQLQRVVLVLLGGGGMWAIWAGFLPALGFFDDIILWRVSVAESVEVVTIRDLAVCLATLFLTAISVKNLPGLLELVFLRRLPLDAGARYAVATITRYAIGVIGVVLALSFIRIQWSQYGWLVAAATVGLGFGLQEIFANFVSGLILLLERPVRVGDIVTVADTTGVVSRIQLRATVVTNWDRQELIVPNKELVTGRLLNWTLSNQTSRVVLTVGVAYGTDTVRARELLLALANGHERVLAEPSPLVTFETMGDSSLNFVMRCCVSSVGDRLTVIHELNDVIHRRFCEEGIEIPFPQRDLNVRNWPEHLQHPAAESSHAGL